MFIIATNKKDEIAVTTDRETARCPFTGLPCVYKRIKMGAWETVEKVILRIAQHLVWNEEFGYGHKVAQSL